MGLIFIPIYIKYLGAEAYGLIGLFAIVTTWLSLLDMGITPTLGREMARFSAGNHTPKSIRDLLRTMEIIALGIALVIVCGMTLSSKWLANSWLKAEMLPIEVIVQAFIIMGLIAGFRFIEGIYRSSIFGLQRQVLFNALSSILATVRGFGAIAVLAWISPTITAFFFWQATLELISLVVLAATTYKCLPIAEKNAYFSLDALRDVWRFASGMTGILFLTLLSMQVDKILLSKLLSLTEYGYYTLAVVIAGGLYMIVTPITQAFYPFFCELSDKNDYAGFAKAYHRSAQMVSVLAGSLAIVIIIFAEIFLRLWTRDYDLATRVSPLLAVLMFGNLLSGLMFIPYQAQLANGWTSLALRINIVAISIVVPAILWATPRFGSMGAAWVWVALNAGYVLIGIHFMHRRILTAEKLRWYVRDLLLPLGGSLVAVLIIKAIWPMSGGVISEIMLLLAALIAGICFGLILALDIRVVTYKFFKNKLGH
jgi:O-antigen/teichoic acid export membrane protein